MLQMNILVLTSHQIQNKLLPACHPLQPCPSLILSYFHPVSAPLRSHPCPIISHQYHMHTHTHPSEDLQDASPPCRQMS